MLLSARSNGIGATGVNRLSGAPSRLLRLNPQPPVCGERRRLTDRSRTAASRRSRPARVDVVALALDHPGLFSRRTHTLTCCFETSKRNASTFASTNLNRAIHLSISRSRIASCAPLRALGISFGRPRFRPPTHGSICHHLRSCPCSLDHLLSTARPHPRLIAHQWGRPPTLTRPTCCSVGVGGRARGGAKIPPGMGPSGRRPPSASGRGSGRGSAMVVMSSRPPLSPPWSESPDATHKRPAGTSPEPPQKTRR